MPFELHPQLAADTVPVLDLDLCTVRLMNCKALPWLVLVPRRVNLREITDLEENERRKFWDEIHAASLILKNLFNPHKLNVAALGNVVPQLHMHIVARFENDLAWPKPVWGNLPIEPYVPEATAAMITEFKKQFSAAKSLLP
jgi:diadenosine tetraphosphate (Ap4A) HIT family hydrolase